MCITSLYIVILEILALQKGQPATLLGSTVLLHIHTRATTTTTTTTISSPGLRRGHVKKNAFHVKGVGEIVNQTVKSDRAIAPLLKTNNSTEGRQVEIS